MKPVPSEKGEKAVVQAAGRLPPEDRLLWLVCRAELDPGRRLLRETVEGTLAWNRVVDKGRYHRLLDLLHHHLHRCGHLGAVPAAERARLDESRAQARDMQSRLDAALAHCTNALDAVAVEHVLVKGPTLQALYPDDVVRAAGDLDFLVHEEDLGAATAALGRAGFALQTPVPEGLTTAETVRYCHTFEQLRFLGDDGAEVELHFRLHNYGPPSVREPLWDSVACWRAADGSARAGVGLEELFLYLVSHLNLHAFGRILWYYDVAEFYGTWRRHIDWASLARMAVERRLGVSFYQTLHWTVELLWPEWDLEPDSTRCARLPCGGRPSTGCGVATRFSPWPPDPALRRLSLLPARRRFAAAQGGVSAAGAVAAAHVAGGAPGLRGATRRPAALPAQPPTRTTRLGKDHPQRRIAEKVVGVPSQRSGERYWLDAGYVILRCCRCPPSSPSPSSATEQTRRVMAATGKVYHHHDPLSSAPPVKA